MVFTRQKSIAGADTESPPRTQPEINTRELCTPGRTVFTQEQNKLLVQQFFQYSQEKEGDDLHYHGLGSNNSSTEDDKNTAFRKMALQFHPDKNKHL